MVLPKTWVSNIRRRNTAANPLRLALTRPVAQRSLRLLRLPEGQRGTRVVRLRFLPILFAAVALLLQTATAAAQDVAIAAASDLKFALDDIVAGFKVLHPGAVVAVTYGSSGKFLTQIQQGAPFDLYFSADIAYPRQLVAAGLAGSAVKPYAIGRLAVWSTTLDASKMTLQSLSDPKISRIAIANPKHAPYGKRAREALVAAGLWTQLEPKIVMGESIAHAAQFVQSGAAQVGILAASLAGNPQLAKQGGYWLIPAHLHSPLEQGLVLTRRGAAKPLAKAFAEHMDLPATRALLVKHGFGLPAPVPAN